LPSIPPSQSNPYSGAQATGAARASLQRALDNYKTGHINLPHQLSGTDLHRSDTRSFGESHASELSSIASDDASPGIPSTPPHSENPFSDDAATTAPKPAEQDVHSVVSPINPAALNQSPATIPTGDSAQQPSSVGASESALFTSNAPTIAETGIPVTAGAAGPGPATGSLHDVQPNVAPAPAPGNETAEKYESAEAEKKRLAAAYSRAAGEQPTDTGASTSQNESAEDEKKRLEREERERLLRNSTGDDGASGKDHEELPPYHDF
jgi:hypothetical protein